MLKKKERLFLFANQQQSNIYRSIYGQTPGITIEHWASKLLEQNNSKMQKCTPEEIKIKINTFLNKLGIENDGIVKNIFDAINERNRNKNKQYIQNTREDRIFKIVKRKIDKELRLENKYIESDVLNILNSQTITKSLEQCEEIYFYIPEMMYENATWIYQNAISNNAKAAYSESVNIANPLKLICNTQEEELEKIATFSNNEALLGNTVCITSTAINGIAGKLEKYIKRRRNDECNINPDYINNHYATKKNLKLLWEIRSLAARFEHETDKWDRQLIAMNKQAIWRNINSKKELTRSQMCAEIEFEIGLTPEFFSAECMMLINEIIQDMDHDEEKLSPNSYLESLLEFSERDQSNEPTVKKGAINILPLNAAVIGQFDYTIIALSNGDYWPKPTTTNPFAKATNKSQSAIDGKSLCDKTESLLNIINRQCGQLIFSSSLSSDEGSLMPQSFACDAEELYLDLESHTMKSDCETEQVEDSYVELIQDGNKCPKSTRFPELYNQCAFMGTFLSRAAILYTENEQTFQEQKIHGEIIHRVLENIWGKLKNTNNLRALSHSTISRMVNTETIDQLEQYQYAVEPPKWFVEHEKQSIPRLILQALEIDKQRNFEVVSLEKRKTLNLYGLIFTIFIDRIEKESYEKDGEIINEVYASDHKTGDVTISDWLKERCPKPQVPIYAQVNEFDGVILNIIREENCSHKGVTRTKSANIRQNRINQSYDELKDIWREDLGITIQNIKRGFSEVNPQTPKYCEHCKLKNGCRVKI